MDRGDGAESTTLAGRYELGSLLGHGGMGAVREATDRRLGRQVAVKILRADLAEQPRARRRFETEAHAAARLAHPNVVTVFDSGEDNGVPFLVMERLGGRTLADELTGGPLSLERGCAVASEILSALAAAHAAGIIHRDIKPGNVLLTDDGHVKVSDFGIAKTVDDLDQTQTTELIATPAYLAPERLVGEAASQQSDLYSVGVLLYEALSGRRPFGAGTPLAMMSAIERGEAAPLAQVGPELPPEIVAVIERAMSVDPAHRFESAGDMAAALRLSPEPVPDLERADLDPTVPIDVSDVPETIPVSRGASDGATQVLHRTSPAPVPDRAGPPTPDRAGRRRLVALGVGAALVAGIVEIRRDDGLPVVPSATTKPPAAGTPTSQGLPAPLDEAIRDLEQAVTK